MNRNDFVCSGFDRLISPQVHISRPSHLHLVRGRLEVFDRGEARRRVGGAGKEGQMHSVAYLRRAVIVENCFPTLCLSVLGMQKAKLSH